MITLILQWIQEHSGFLIEILGVVTALVYLFFSIKQKIWLWPFGILTSGFYLYVFFSSRLYADMGLQGYYLMISIYGWYYWSRGGERDIANALQVSRVGKKQGLLLILTTVLIYWLTVWVLINIPGILDLPPSDIPYWDALTTATSVVATWMLARKILEHWLVWIVVDALSIVIYIYKGLYLTSALFFVYATLAIIGYFEWKKDFKTVLDGNPGS